MKKSRYLLLILSLILILSAGACAPGPRAAGTPNLMSDGETVYLTYQLHLRSLDVSSGITASETWKFPTEPNNKIIMYAQAEVSDDAVYIGDLSNTLRKLDKNTGNELWAFDGAKGWFIGQAASAGDIVLAPSADRTLYAINAKSGQEEWHFTTEHPLWANPLVIGNTVYLGSMDSKVYALDLNTGKDVWEKSETLAGAIVSAPVYDEALNQLYVTNLGGQVVALNADNGTINWQYPDEAKDEANVNSLWTSPIVHDTQVFIVDEDGLVVSLNSETGSEIWRKSSGGSVKAGLVALEDGLIVALENGEVIKYQYDGSTEDTLYTVKSGQIYNTPVIANDLLVFSVANGENLLYGYNKDNQLVLSELEGITIKIPESAWQTFIVKPFTNVLLLITAGVKNFGIAIILFTLLIKLLTYPLNAKQMKSAKAMQDLQSDPRYKKMMTKYKNDRERLAQEQMKLYKELGINPMGSCLPMLVQFPIIIGLYQSITKAMAATPFELINLKQTFYPWLDPAKILPLQNKFLWMDLGQPERLYIGTLGIPVLAVIVVLTTYLQTKLTQPPSTNPNDQAAAMTKSMNIYMPLLMGWLAYSYASGLALYFLVSNLASIAQFAIQGRLDWSNVIPGLKSKAPAETPKPVVIDLEEEEEEVETVKEAKPSARAAVKQKRPQMKRKK